jgi:hypothetical protein
VALTRDYAAAAGLTYQTPAGRCRRDTPQLLQGFNGAIELIAIAIADAVD